MIDLAKMYKQHAVKRVQDSDMEQSRKDAYIVLIETCENDLFADTVRMFEYETSIIRRMKREQERAE